MPVNRREFLGLAATGFATGLLVSNPLAGAATGARI